jgi:transcriptional regulator with XRE-family HTH domain
MQHGKIIKSVIRHNHFTVREVPQKIKISRQSISNWFNKESINNELIYKMGKIWNYNFSAEFPHLSDRQRFLSNQLIGDQSKTVRLESVVYWRNKYITFVEKQNEVSKYSSIGPTSYQNNLNNLPDVTNDPTH